MKRRIGIGRRTGGKDGSRRGLKVALALLAGFAVLLILNAVAMSNATRNAEITVEGGELIETSVGTIQVLDEGPSDGPVVALVHCFTCSLNWWQELAPRLVERGDRVIRIDLLGHGGSEKPKSGYSIPDQGLALTEVLNKLGVTEATVVGHSLGGAVAVEVAQQSPELVPRIMTIGTEAEPGQSSLSLIARLGFKPIIGPALKRLTSIAPTALVRAQLEQAFAPGFNLAKGFQDPDQVVDDLRALTYSSYKANNDAFDDYIEEQSFNDRLAEAGTQATIVFGSEDQIVTDEDAAAATYADMPGIKVVIMDGIGHSANVEAPDRTAALISELVDAGLQADAAEAKRRAAERAAAKRAAARKRAAEKKAAAERQAARKKQATAAK